MYEYNEVLRSKRDEGKVKEKCGGGGVGGVALLLCRY